MSVPFPAIVMVSCTALLAYGMKYITSQEWWAILLLAIFLAIIIICVSLILRQPQNLNFTTFKVSTSSPLRGV